MASKESFISLPFLSPSTPRDPDSGPGTRTQGQGPGLGARDPDSGPGTRSRGQGPGLGAYDPDSGPGTQTRSPGPGLEAWDPDLGPRKGKEKKREGKKER